MWTIPNLLTLARILAIGPLVACIEAGWWIAASALFAAAAITDWLDGWLARRWNQQSDLGRMLDPIADKLIVAAVLVALIAAAGNGWSDLATDGHRTLGLIFTGKNGETFWTPSIWATIAIVTRELFVAGLREYLGPKGVTVRVSPLAKWKTASQLAALALLLLSPALWPYTDEGSMIANWIGIVGNYCLQASAILAWITALGYTRAALRHMEAPR